MQQYIHTRLGLKETTETQRCLCASQISHVSLLYHTDTSSQYSLLHEGQVPACCHREKEGGRKRVVGKQLYVNQKASFLSLHTFPLPRIYIFPSYFIHSSFSLSLSTEESSLSIGIEALWRWSRTMLLAASTLLPTYHPATPSTLNTHPSALRGPGSCSAQRNHAPNPSLGLALLPQASQAVPLHCRDREVGGLEGE